ncbi:MAG: nucleotide exchange factor GrpE [Candidatus Bathyarchaeota archaeon]
MTRQKSNTCKPSRVPMEESSKKEESEETVKKLSEELEAEQEKSKQYLNRLKYLQADFENYRKRVEKEVQEAVQRSNEQLIACLIGVLDDLESAIQAGETTENKAALLEGIRMVHKNLEKLLENEGLERLECVGQAFDPRIHEILAQIPTKEHESGTVLEEARKGFMFKGKVLRPSIVKVACEDSEECDEK